MPGVKLGVLLFQLGVGGLGVGGRVGRGVVSAAGTTHCGAAAHPSREERMG